MGLNGIATTGRSSRQSRPNCRWFALLAGAVIGDIPDRHIIWSYLMRILHTMLRVTDLERSLAFYTEVLGMRLLRRQDYPEGRFTLAFVGYEAESASAVVELTHNWDTHHYDLGNGFGHIAIGVEDLYGACETLRQRGGVITREPGPMKHGTTHIAFVRDPDGYAIELIQSRS
jgi:lactoylglutathione lyase